MSVFCGMRCCPDDPGERQEVSLKIAQPLQRWADDAVHAASPVGDERTMSLLVLVLSSLPGLARFRHGETQR